MSVELFMRRTKLSELISKKFDVTLSFNKFVCGPVHTMPDKFEKGALFCRLCILSTLIRTNPDKFSIENAVIMKAFSLRVTVVN